MQDSTSTQATADDTPVNWGLILGILDTLEAHGFKRGDDQHVGKAIGMISELAKVYATRD